ncbi:MAG TPA: YdcF family protein [Pyrinomonadaceae bacterium]
MRAPLGGAADAVAVLSGGEVYGERAETAARLFREGRAARVVLTNDGEPGGWSHERERTMMFVERAQETLIRAGVPPSAIEVVPGRVTSTHEEAAALSAYARGRGWHALVVVTSGYHSRRAWWTLRRTFAQGDVRVGLETAAGAQSPSAWTWWLSPAGWRMVAGEYVKLVYYRLHY